jgi:O-antigen/teichoic acid export membrane protein
MFNVLIEYLITIIYSKEYINVVQYTRIISIAVIVQGFSLFINTFLNSKGVGKRLLKSAMLKGFINLSGFILLVKLLGVDGACYTLIISNTIVLVYLVFHYRRFIKNPVCD